jgi:tyrosyl-DNA phosphodiesterase-1
MQIRGADDETESKDHESVKDDEDVQKDFDQLHMEGSSKEQPPGINPQSKDQSYCRYIHSPFRLTRIRDLPQKGNKDTITIHDILRDPMIRECWQFNFLFDIDFVMGALDPDIAANVRVKIVHGFWKSDDACRLRLQEQAQVYSNVQLIAAHMPEPFGTHHSKMMVVLRHDDAAQVVIHTANMIPKDWANLTQGVWRSPLLPLLSRPPQAEEMNGAGDLSPPGKGSQIGSGLRFKTDLIRYLKAYQGRTRSLVDELEKYDFTSIHAAFTSSVPSRVRESTSAEQTHTEFGWSGLRQILSSISSPERKHLRPGPVVVQISSIATLTEKWFDNFRFVLHSNSRDDTPVTLGKTKKPRIHILFPSAEEVRQSLDGYASGASIHMKIQSTAQVKQLAMLRPMLCHWAPPKNEDGRAGRSQAAPHIKTYISFADEKMEEIQWAMLTSANLSQQAWGAPANDGNVRICSYEVGVVVWPRLFLEPEEESDWNARMVPMFGKDMPSIDEAERLPDRGKKNVVVGIRMPYNLPLARYGPNTMPWCASATYLEPDSKGQVWGDVDAATLAGIRGARMLQSAEE